MKRAYDEWLAGHVEIVVCLVPAATSAPIFHGTLAKVADIYFLEGRPRFSKVDKSSEPTMANTMVVIFGASAEQRERFASLVRGTWLVLDKSRPTAAGDPFSCAAPALRDGVRLKVICGPSAEAA